MNCNRFISRTLSATIFSTVFAFSGAVQAVESLCQTDGCVMVKNAQMTAVLNWIQTHDDCINAVSWLQVLTKQDDIHFQLICGSADPAGKQEIILSAEVLADAKIIIKRTK